MTILLSPSGCVCDIAQSNQLSPNESQDMCGPWTASALKFAGLPGKGALASGAGTENPIDDWAENEYTKYIGPNTASDGMGSSIDNMHEFFRDAGNLHYFDIADISPSSEQASDLAHIRAALSAGYPVAVTVGELSVISKKLGRCPYPWQPRLGDVNHVLPIIGIDKDGDFIVADQLNSFESWPQVYLAGPLSCHWASIIQLVGPDAMHPWLAPIPSGDPTSWPVGFNAQNFGGNVATNVPKGWSLSSDKLTLTAPNGQIAVLGFMNKILSSSWDPSNVMLEREHGDGAGGTEQLCNDCMLTWNPKSGIVVQPLGVIVLTQRVQLAAQAQQIQGLIAQVNAAKQVMPPQVVSALSAALHSMADAGAAVQNALNSQPPAPAVVATKG